MLLWAGALGCVGATGCGSQVYQQSRSDFGRAREELTGAQAALDEAEEAPLADPALGTLRSYVAAAFSNSPALRASFEQWRAALEQPAQAREIPGLVLTYGGFIRAVETRVGPQRHRLGAMQWFPWPSRLTANADAAGYAALSAQQQFEAHALDLAAEVAQAYWNLWRIQKAKQVERDEREILRSFSEQVRARLEAGRAGLSDLAQVDLAISRVADSIASLGESERKAAAELVRIIGAPDGTRTPVRPELDPPDARLPILADTVLKERAIEHPRVKAMASMSEAAQERARAVKGERAPSLGLGVEWIVTGEAPNPNTQDSGKDAVVGMLSVKIPVSGGAYRAAQREATAQSAAYRAKEQAARDRAIAEVEQTLADLRDAVRRVQLYASTLLPQAETTYRSTLDGYRSGRSSLAEVLIAEKALLELALGLFDAHADYGTVWAELERVVGQPLATRGAQEEAVP
jgi:outer membrane protein TolC